MREIEKRIGLGLEHARTLKIAIDNLYERQSVVNRTILVKVENSDFSPDPDAPLDIKVKLIGDQTILSTKHGSWHGDVARDEYEVNFRRSDLANIIATLKLLGYKRFIVLSTVRTTWFVGNIILTLDEYEKIGKALFEAELDGTGGANGEEIDAIFGTLDLKPMTSSQTVAFISSVNQSCEIQVDLDRTTPDTLAAELLGSH